MIDVKALLALGCTSRRRIGIGVPPAQFDATLKKLGSIGCSAELVMCSTPDELISSLRSGELDGAVRGTMPSSSVVSGLRSGFGLDSVMRTALLSDKSGRPYLLTPVGIDEGKDMASRLNLVRSTLSYFEHLGWDISIGVISRGRSEDVHRGEEIRTSIEDGERICEALKGDGRYARHYGILIEEAVRESDLVVAPDGVSGNLIFRALHLVAGSDAYGAPVVNLRRVFVDTSRAKVDFSDSVMLAAGLAESLEVR